MYEIKEVIISNVIGLFVLWIFKFVYFGCLKIVKNVFCIEKNLRVYNWDVIVVQESKK